MDLKGVMKFPDQSFIFHRAKDVENPKICCSLSDQTLIRNQWQEIYSKSVKILPRSRQR